MQFGRSATRAKLSAGFLSLWFILIVIWTAANSSAAVETLAAGAVISAVIAYYLSQHEVWRGVRLSPSRFYHFVRYTGAFFVELVRANIDMMRLVYSRRIDIAPGVVEIKTGLKSPVARLALANSIALTPGSLVLDITDDTLSIHWLDVKTADQAEATRTIAGPFERHLEKVFE